MLKHFDEMVAGVRYLVCTYANGSSNFTKGRYRAVVYQMCGSEIEEEVFDAGWGENFETHVRLDLLAIKAALEQIGETPHPIVVLTRLEYLPLHMRNLRGSDFHKTDGNEAANADLLRAIAALDPENKIEWRFADKRDYEQRIEAWKREKQVSVEMARAQSRDLP